MSVKILHKLNNGFSDDLLRDPEKMRIILDAADIPINYCSADRIFLFVNKTYAEWYGKKPEDIIGKSLEEVLGEEGESTIRPYYERALKGEHFRYETEVNLSIGYRYIQCSYTPVIDSHGQVTGWVGIIYDMTQRYLLEKTLHENEAALKLAKEKAEAANIAKSDFMANMSHEIRTPMNAVVGLSHILSLSMPLTPKQQELINTLQLSAQSLLALINDLLDFSKIESNSIELDSVEFTFNDIISKIIGMFSVEAEEKKVTFDHVKSPLDDEAFIGDPLRIRQIVTNLISNAVKFSHNGGRITISLSTTPCSEPGEQYVHISVRDNGIGIPANKIPIVFDKFMQADMSITRQYGGSGLGLAISKNLAELMSGSITVNSIHGEGSEFVLHLPLEKAPPRGSVLPFKEKENTPGHQPETVSVLLAEDHAPNILVATTMLEGLGYRCDVARSGNEVLEKINGNPGRYDIVLMDVQMPELDGYMTTQILRETEQKKGLKRLPIIAVTAHVMDDYVRKCFEAGMDDYIAKPFNPDDLKQKISTLTDK